LEPHSHDESPVIARDAARRADLVGARLPHVWLGPGRSIYDTLGDGFTLLVLARDPSVAAPAVDAARSRGVPLAVVDLGGTGLRERYDPDVLLVRPDQYVAWHGNVTAMGAPEVGTVLDRVRGVSQLDTMHRRGSQVIIAGRREPALAEVVTANPGMSALTLDVTDPEQIRQAVPRVWDLIDAIIGWNERCQPFTWTRDADTIIAKAHRQPTSGTRHSQINHYDGLRDLLGVAKSAQAFPPPSVASLPVRHDPSPGRVIGQSMAMISWPPWTSSTCPTM